MRHSRRRSPIVAISIAVLQWWTVACSSLHLQPAAEAPEPREPPALTPRVRFGGWMFAPEKPAARAPASRRAFILRGTRWIDHLDGSIERAREVFREEDVRALELPPHLGGGFLFYAATGSETLMWRADSWTGALRPLGRVEPPVSEITSGFDRLYLSSASSESLRAIDAFTGQPRDLGTLPEAATYGDLVFSDAWRAVVLAGVQGALATFDAGESWHPVGAPAWVTDLSTTRTRRIVLGTDRGRFELDQRGRLVQTSASGNDALFAGAETFARFGRDAFPGPAPNEPVPLPLGSRPLRSAVLAGYPDTPDTAVVVDRGVVARVRLSDGKLLDTQPYAGALPCRGVPLGSSFGFVCGDAYGPTEVHGYQNGSLALEFSLDTPRAVRSSGNGALVVAAPCAALRQPGGAAARSAPAERALGEPDELLSRHCARLVSGELLDVRVRGEAGTERIAALRDGRVAIVVPPRAGVPGRLSLVSRSGAITKQLEFGAEPGPGQRLVRSGSWLDELWEDAEGQLGAWVIGAQTFAGVAIGLDGKLEISRLEEGLAETSFYGPSALHIVSSGNVRESTNHGFDWSVSELPPALISSPPPASLSLRGCGAVGCVHDDWLRIGWSADETAAEPARPEPPGEIAASAPSFAFWSLSCNAATDGGGRAAVTARVTRPELALGAGEPASGPRRAGASKAPESSAWLSFQGQAAPERRAGELGYDFGETNENAAYRAYAWGPAAGNWSRAGTWLIRVGDRFSTDAPWSTGPSRTPWLDASLAGQAFGLDPNVGVDWWLRMGATGRFGVLQIRARAEGTIHLVDRERAITTLQAGAMNDLGSVSGAFELNDQWYVGLTRADQFQLYRVDRDKPELVATYPLWGRVTTQLIHSVQGDAMALWQKSSGSGWYVYPINRTTFAPEPALHVPTEKLSRVPPACEPGRPGWIAVSGVPLRDSALSESNTHLSFPDAAEPIKTKRLTARVVIDDTGVCVDALAALSDGVFSVAAASESRAASSQKSQRRSLPLTITDSANERQFAFRCRAE